MVLTVAFVYNVTIPSISFLVPRSRPPYRAWSCAAGQPVRHLAAASGLRCLMGHEPCRWTFAVPLGDWVGRCASVA